MNVYNENKNNKFFFKTLPLEIKETFAVRYNINKKVFIIQIDEDYQQVISNIKSLYYLDDIFYVTSELYMFVFWVDIKQYQLIERMK